MQPSNPIDVDALAQEIRRVDGRHSLGAGALAEALLPFIAAALSVEEEPYGHWVKHRLADGVFLPKVCYIPTGPDYTVVPLYTHSPTPVSSPRDEERLKGERDETVGWIGTVECPCTTFEQDETCPVGYPSLLCGACGGKGVVRAETVMALAAEMLKIAEQVDELEDPFAAWESIELLKSASLSDRSVSGEAARIGDAVLSWLVKFDLADAGNEYRAEDVVNILNELAPVSQPQSDRSVSGDAVRVKDNWLHLDELKREGVFPREVLVAAWNGESYTISQACAFEDGSFRWCWETDLDETVSDDGFEIHSWQPLPDAPRSALLTADRTEEGRNEP